jgi:hypothetical protein
MNMCVSKRDQDTVEEFAQWYGGNSARGVEEKYKDEVYLHLPGDTYFCFALSLTTRERCTARDGRLQSSTEQQCRHIYGWQEHERAKRSVLMARWITSRSLV